MPFSRGNSPERVESVDSRRRVRRGRGPIRQKAASASADADGPSRQPKLPESPSALQFPVPPAVDASRGQRPRDAARRRRSATRCETCSATWTPSSSTTRRAAVSSGPNSVRHQGRRVRAVGPALHRPGEAQLADDSLRGDVDEGPRRHHVQRAQGTGRITDVTVVGPSQSTRSTRRRSARWGLEPDPAAAARVPVRPGVFHRDVLLQRNAATVIAQSQQL